MNRQPLCQSPDLSRALGLMSDALAILDEQGAPGEIGAHLDHAIAVLEAGLGASQYSAESLEALILASGIAADPGGAGASI
jgi:hypothetical protein